MGDSINVQDGVKRVGLVGANPSSVVKVGEPRVWGFEHPFVKI
jgi:hypothetical protein